MDTAALVFQSPNGGPLRHSNFRRRVWIPALKEARLPIQLRIHDLRHTCAALLIERHAHPKEIQAHLGHASITTTLDRYGHLFPERLQELGDELDGMYQQSISRPARGLPKMGDALGEPERRIDQDKPLWGGVDSNHRPTDYESAALTN